MSRNWPSPSGGQDTREEIKQALGFENGVTPHQTTIQRLFRRVNAEELEAAFRIMFLHIVNTDQEQRGGCAVAIDGKAHRGRVKFEGEKSYPVHEVSLVDHQTGIVLTQGHVEKTDVEPIGELPGENKQEEHEALKQKSELAVASRLIQHIDWKGKVQTGDALYCQRDVCSTLRASRRRVSISGEGKSASPV